MVEPEGLRRLLEANLPFRDLEVAPAEQADEAAPAEGKHVAPAQAAPDRFEPLHAFRVRIAGEVCAVDGAHGGADDQVGLDLPREQLAQHADLNGAEAAAAGEHEGGLHAHRTSHEECSFQGRINFVLLDRRPARALRRRGTRHKGG
jgi:hypothetical protein